MFLSFNNNYVILALTILIIFVLFNIFYKNLLHNIMSNKSLNKNKNYLSKNTQKLIQGIDNLNDNYNIGLDTDYINPSQIEDYYNTIFNIYNKINYKIDLLENSVLNKNKNLCNTFDLLEYLRDNQLIETYDNKEFNHKGKKLTFKNIVSERNVEGCKIWINIFGKDLLRDIFSLKQMGKIPENLVKDIKSIDDDLFSEFTPIDIFEFISENNLVKQTLVISCNNLKIYLKLVSKTKISNKKRDLLIKRICLMYLLKNPNSNPPLTIKLVILFSDPKKELPIYYNVLGPREINSGVTTFADNKILLYRNEEHSKLLIHELIHLLNIDFHYINIPELSSLVDINPNIETRPNESITELFAVIINSILVTIELTNTKNLVTAKALLNTEINYNLIQCAKVLKHFNYNNANDFFRENNKNTKFNQTTSVISYFFMKTACLFNTQDTLNFINNNYTDFNYNNKNEAVTNYQKLVVTSLSNKEFHKILNKILQILRNKKNVDNSYFFKTLRMTCVELD